MPADLKSQVTVVFASGTKLQNELVLDRYPENLVVVAEFEPQRGEWIPYHVHRTFLQNKANIVHALKGRKISTAVVLLAKGTAYMKMRALAASLAPLAMFFLDEELKPASPLSLVSFGPARRWMKRIARPKEAEIPIRARLAQAEGEVGSRIRAKGRELPMGGHEPLADGVTVVIPSRDGRELLAALLPTITADEIIVVDNGSSDGTAEWLGQNFPGVLTIQTQSPLSFARAVNAGIVKARFRYTLLLNNDMVVEPGFVEALTKPFGRIPDLFCTTAQIFFPPGIRREETGKAVWRKENPLDFPVRCDDPIPGEDWTPVLYGSGGCSLFDTARLRELGGVSEVYEPAYVEDMDFGYRAWKRGWLSIFCAEAKVEHRHRATTSRFFTSAELDYFVERNYLRFLIHAVGSPALFRVLWKQAIRRLQLLGSIDVLRKIPPIGPKPPEVSGRFSETEILALGNGDVACFQGNGPKHEEVLAIASPYLPFPLSHGGAVRIFNLMKQAAKAKSLILIVLCDELKSPAAELLDLCREVVLVKRHGTHYRRSTALPDVVQEFDSETFRAMLKYTVARWRPNTVQLEFTWMAQYAAACAPARTVLVEHDITFDLQEQLLALTPNWELQQQVAKWRNYETNCWRQVDRVVVMSAKDKAMVKGAKEVVILPNGVDCDRFQPSDREPEPKRLLFIGSFAHLPNVLALEFFLKEVWPLLGPGYTLHIIGGHLQKVPFDLNLPGIELEGFVADVRPAYERAELVLAPLTASAGTNIKVLEAMAMGREVITTAAGLNGLDLNPGTDIVLVKDAAEMAEAIRRGRRREIEKAARETALRFDWSSLSSV